MSDAPSEFDQSFPGLIPCIWQLAGFSFCESFGLCGQAYRKPVKRDQTMWSPHLKWQKRPQNAALLFPVPLCSGRRHVSISAAEAGRMDGRWLPVWLLRWCNRTHSVIRWPVSQTLHCARPPPAHHSFHFLLFCLCWGGKKCTSHPLPFYYPQISQWLRKGKCVKDSPPHASEAELHNGERGRVRE